MLYKESKEESFYRWRSHWSDAKIANPARRFPLDGRGWFTRGGGRGKGEEIARDKEREREIEREIERKREKDDNGNEDDDDGDGVANMAAPESEAVPSEAEVARLRRGAVVAVVDGGVGVGGSRVTAARDQYLHARRDAARRGERRDAERRAPRTAPGTKDVEFEKCYSARLSLNDMEGNASPTWVPRVRFRSPRARAKRAREEFARVSPE